MTERIGVFICDCGTNISETVDTSKLSEFSSNIKDVAVVKIHKLWCSQEGRQQLRDAIKENNISRVVIAACSPKEHEVTFRNVLASAGLNPYLLQIANIREQIAWVTKDKELATKKAVAQLNAAMRRVRLHQPLEKSEIDCKGDFVVIGAGVAGMSAALTLAQKGRRVYLVEKEPWIGGKVVGYEDVFPKLECAPCMLEPKMDEVLHNERITLLTNSEVENIKGFFGNFQVQIRRKSRMIDAEKCIGCQACFEACPVKTENKFNAGLSQRSAVYISAPGLLPNVAAIDGKSCLRSKGEDCRKCEESCPFGAVDYSQKDEVISVDAGGIVIATGFELFSPQEIKGIGIGSPNVIDSFKLERLLSSTGPTEGRLEVNGKAPGSMAIIHCVGGRDKRFKEYCSAVCCAYSLKLAHLAGKKIPGLKIYEIFSDWCLPGRNYQEFHDKVSGEGTKYIRVANPNDIKISEKDGKVSVSCSNPPTAIDIKVDLAVLSTAMIPSADARRISAMTSAELDKDGFYSAEHEKLSAASTAVRGIYIAGCAAGPKDITQSVLQAQAAAGAALSVIVPGEKLELEVATSKVDEKLCGGCHTCLSLCPYQAISFDEEKKVAVINEVLCMGCGVCVSACPAGAISNKNFTTEQIFSEIEGVLE